MADSAAIDGVVVDAGAAGGPAVGGEGKLPAMPTAEVVFRGRTVTVKAPSAEQLVVLRRIGRRMADAAKLESLEAEKIVALMDRALKAISTVIADPEVVEWVEDLWLEGDLDLQETLPLVTSATKALSAKADADADKGRARAAGKKPAARRARLAK